MEVLLGQVFENLSLFLTSLHSLPRQYFSIQHFFSRWASLGLGHWACTGTQSLSFQLPFCFGRYQRGWHGCWPGQGVLAGAEGAKNSDYRQRLVGFTQKVSLQGWRDGTGEESAGILVFSLPGGEWGLECRMHAFLSFTGGTTRILHWWPKRKGKTFIQLYSCFALAKYPRNFLTG